MKTTNKALCIAGATLSAPALIFCLDALSEVHTGTSAVFMGILASLFASMFTICAMVFLNQKLLVFKNIFKNANDAITIIDAKGRYIWQNRANKNLCGFDNGEITKPEGIFTTCSFGVAKLDKNLEICIENADNAMYFVKQNGRNSVMVFENNNQNP